MKNLYKEKCWVVMSKDRTLIAKGVPRNRYLYWLTDELAIQNGQEPDNASRILTYTSKGRAEMGFKNHNGFYNEHLIKGLYDYYKDGVRKGAKNGELEDYLEAVEVQIEINEITGV